MNTGDWPSAIDGPMDLAVSAAAIQHLGHQRKYRLAQAVFDRPVPAACTSTYDLSATRTPRRT